MEEMNEEELRRKKFITSQLK